MLRDIGEVIIMNKQAVIGLDQSYTDTGIAIGVNGRIRAAKSIPLEKLGSDTLKRNSVIDGLYSAIELCRKNGIFDCDISVYIEQPRINKGQTTFDYIKRAGAMESCIVDYLYNEYNGIINMYSVSSNAWKAVVLGTREERKNNVGIDPRKYLMYEYCIEHGFDDYVLQTCSKQTKRFVTCDANGNKLKYNDNIGDAIGICMYGFVPENDQKKKCLL